MYEPVLRAPEGSLCKLRAAMHLMYYLDDKGNRVYTLKVRPPWCDISGA